jgi:hypothetical protein
MSTKRKLATVTGFALISALLLSRASLGDDSPAAAGPGVWQKHQYSFTFIGFTSTYSCDGLADKTRLLLIAAGARQDAKAQAGPCASGFGRPDKFARADLTFYTLAPNGAGAPVDGTPVEGTWRAVSLTPRSPRDLQLGDCELIEQFRQSVLPMFSIRNVDDHTTCIPHQESGSSIDLKFESFAAAPAGPRAAQAR